VSFLSGGRLDVAAAARVAHDAGALFCLDAYQSSGVQALDVRALGVDILVAGALKYLLGPPGVAFLYVRGDLVDGLRPLDSGWFAQENPFAFEGDRLCYAPTANRFQSGSPPIPSVYGARAGLALVREVGTPAIEEHVAALATRLIEGATAAGYALRTPEDAGRRGPLVVLRSRDADQLAARLAERGVLCAPRGDGLRASFHYYNLAEDVDRLLDALAAHEDLLVRGS
jgi:selenocysteine lyase/cysteine desulfurase